MLKNSDIKTALTTIKNPQANALLDMMHQLILNMIVTKDPDNKVFDYIYPWGENLAYISWAIQAYSHSTIKATQDQSVFGRYMIFNLDSVIYWQVITDGK